MDIQTSAEPEKNNSFWASKKHSRKLLIFASVAFLGIICLFIILHRTFLTPDQFYVAAFIFVLITGQVKSFVWDWTPAVLLIFSYEYLRGLIPQINHHVHFGLMPKFDLLIFHTIPASYLQSKFYVANHLHWYDYASVGLYLMHFVVPMMVAFVFWETDRRYFKQYMAGIVTLSFLTFLTYLLFPAAPPWLASQQGLIPHTEHITNIILGHFFNYVSIPTVYQYFGVNLVAAVPSLHAAYPLLTALYVGKKQPKLIPLLIFYVLAVWFAVMYLGEHYFFDVVLGSIYALVVYVVTQRVKDYREKRHAQKLAKNNLQTI